MTTYAITVRHTDGAIEMSSDKTASLTEILGLLRGAVLLVEKTFTDDTGITVLEEP